jgi:hypothetical protein
VLVLSGECRLADLIRRAKPLSCTQLAELTHATSSGAAMSLNRISLLA